ncbi:MAG: polysaccharide deacetylase family protein [Thermoleophilia bacterium]|nr:polysaccharide deacetylase family protein [Thermoleophilia bacterium]
MTAGPHAVRSPHPRGTSRVPAVTILLLLAVVVAGVGFLLSCSPNHQPAVEVSLGLSAAAGVESAGDGGYSKVESAALAVPLPEDAIDVHVPVLMYHYVDEEPPPAGPYADGLTVRTPDFIRELEYLVVNGHRTVTLAEVYLAMAGVRELPAKPVALTFDDGGLDNYEVAFPLLKEYGFNATFFVITERIGMEGQMDWDQLREMVAAGMSIQSHTVSHPGLPGLSDARLQSELVESRAIIAEGVGEPGYVLSYPSGAYDQRVIEAAKAAGYVMAVATDHGAEVSPEAPFEITRLRIQPFLPIDSFARLVR